MTETENLGSQRKNFTDWEAAFGELKARYVKQHKLAVKYKEALEKISAFKEEICGQVEPTIEAIIAKEALKDD